MKRKTHEERTETHACDLISRQAAIDVIRKCAVKEVTQVYMLIDKAEAMTELMMLPSAQPEQRWIPVSERLPENDGYYLISIEQEAWFAKWNGVDWTSISGRAFIIEGVLAWMPLPEPYREDGGE